MDSKKEDVSKVTKVLIHKIHGGRKQDSKFWNSEYDLSKKTDETLSIQRPNDLAKKRKLRKSLQFSVYPIAATIIVIVILIIARPDIFPFLDYHNIYSAMDSAFSDKEEIAEIDHTPRIAEHSTPKTQQNSQGSIYTLPRKESSPPVNPIRNSYSTAGPKIILNDAEHRIDLTGKVFSWKDQDGKLYFSNTNFPLDNDTLQVKTELNTYSNVTKISIVGNQIYVPVTLSKNGRSITVNMVLDTGCSITTVPYSQLSRIGADYGRQVTSRVADGRTMYSREARLDIIQVGSQRKRYFTVHGAKVVGAKNSGLLGLDFLKNQKFKIDFEREFLVWM